MTVIPLSRLLETESTHTVCFDRNGEEIAWPGFVAKVASISAALVKSDRRYWALDSSDAFDFACAMYGCWVAGKTPILAPAHMLAADGGIEFDGVIRSSGIPQGSRPTIALDQLDAAPLAEPVVPAASDLILFTSGSTGQPTKVQRTIRNIEAELEVLEGLFGQTIGNGRIYSTVSHEHVYGMLFRLLWPLAAKRPFATYNFEYPENLLNDVSAGGAVVTSPALLKRLGHLDESDACEWRLVFSSGGLLPNHAAMDAIRLLGTSPVEVLGSTETSGVAWRRQQNPGEEQAWETLPSVDVRQGDESFLEVSSPFVGQEDWHRMGDKVRFETDRIFHLLGRGDHIVKIEEKRVSLAEIEQCAIALSIVVDAAAIALEDGARQFIGLVLQLSDVGKAELEDRGRRKFGQKIRQSLTGKLDPVAIPKKFRYVDIIPVNPQGKRQPAVISELFD